MVGLRKLSEVVQKDCQTQQLHRKDAMEMIESHKDRVSVNEFFFWYWLTWFILEKRSLNGFLLLSLLIMVFLFTTVEKPCEYFDIQDVQK